MSLRHIQISCSRNFSVNKVEYKKARKNNVRIHVLGEDEKKSLVTFFLVL